MRLVREVFLPRLVVPSPVGRSVVLRWQIANPEMNVGSAMKYELAGRPLRLGWHKRGRVGNHQLHCRPRGRTSWCSAYSSPSCRVPPSSHRALWSVVRGSLPSRRAQPVGFGKPVEVHGVWRLPCLCTPDQGRAEQRQLHQAKVAIPIQRAQAVVLARRHEVLELGHGPHQHVVGVRHAVRFARGDVRKGVLLPAREDLVTLRVIAAREQRPDAQAKQVQDGTQRHLRAGAVCEDEHLVLLDDGPLFQQRGHRLQALRAEQEHARHRGVV